MTLRKTGIPTLKIKLFYINNHKHNCGQYEHFWDRDTNSKNKIKYVNNHKHNRVQGGVKSLGGRK